LFAQRLHERTVELEEARLLESVGDTTLGEIV